MTLRRVELIPAAAIAAEAVAPWFADAWAAMWGPQTPPTTPPTAEWLRETSEEQRLVALVDGAPLAFVALRPVADALELSALAVAATARNEGAGAEIVWQVEERSSARRVRALFPQANGYAFYFWLRAGYRPLFAADHGWGRINVVERVLR